MSKRYMLAVLLITVLVPAMVMAQGTITGTVTDANTGDALPGANVIVEGQPYGGASDLTGTYLIEGVPAGNYTVTASVIGYESVALSAQVATGVVTTLNFTLTSEALQMTALEVLASRATRETPVAYSNVDKQSMEVRLGSQDIPLVLNTTPSVYATPGGGGAGDARINVRGFNQRNVAIMINGVPVNDMENGWVYWSNWDGVADATSSIQMQRGLSAVNLATPSIGGTMNIITDPATKQAGGLLKQEVGTGNFLKTTASYSSGVINDNLAFNGTIVRKTGDGQIDKTWTDAWAYYLGVSYAASDKNRFELYALGAPQRHGQSLYKQNIAAYDSTFAKSLDDYDPAAIADFPESESGHLYNENWNTVSSDYEGQQYWYMYGEKTVDRYDPGFLNERENYFHKPQVNLNWYWTLSEKMRLSTVFYFSGGSGGGTGTFGDLVWDYSGPSRIADWDATIAINADTLNRKGNAKVAGESVGFLRNSINRQWTLGAISKLNFDISDEFKTIFGVDWRTAEIEHAREVRDLLGGDYGVNGIYNAYSGTYNNYKKPDNPEAGFYNEFDWVFINDTTFDYDATYANASDKKLGDIINYHNTNTVDWTGFFAQAELKKNLYSLYGMAGYSMIKYSLTDFFKKYENHVGEGASATDKGELFIETDLISAVQVKGGGLYRLSEDLNVFANFGYVEKVPILDAVIDDITGVMATSPENEKFISTELGLNWNLLDGKLAAKFNLYNTDWEDRTLTKQVTAGQGSSGDTDIIFLTGMNQNHKGIEGEIAFAPMSLLRFDAAFSFGDWEFVGDASGEYKDYAAGTTETYTYTIDGLKVGDMPQTIIALSASVFPVKGLTLQAVLNSYSRHYSDWDPTSRELGDANDDGVIDEADADRTQSWEIPSYSKVDLHASYMLPVHIGGMKVKTFFHIFNALDTDYIQGALDNSQYNSYDDDHDADDAEVFFGAPVRYNAGISLAF